MCFYIDFSTKNFAEASKINGNNEFQFVIGKKEIPCHKFVAAFISPKIAHLMISDPTIETFYIDKHSMILKNNNQREFKNEELLCSIIEKMIKGERIEITEGEFQEMISEISNISASKKADFSNTKFFSYLALIEALENEEFRQQFYSNLFSFISKGNVNEKNQKQESSMTTQEIEDKIKMFNSIEKILDIINTINIEYFDNKGSIKKIFKDYLNQNYSNIVDESAKHFSEIDESLFFVMNPFIFEDILLSNELTISDEDYLLKILLERRSYILQNQLHENIEGRDEEDLFFLHCVHFECLSEEGIKLFLNEIDIDEINHQTWESLKKRLIMPNRSGSRRNKFYNEFNGIFKHLTDVTKGNIQLNKTIEITCCRYCCGNIEKLVDFNSQNDYVHLMIENNKGWIQFDFKEKKVQINSYLIQSSCRACEDRLRSWKMEISNDGKNWEEIDEQHDVTELDGVSLTKLFKIKKTNQFRFIRLFTDIGSYFAIGKIEFFGTINE